MLPTNPWRHRTGHYQCSRQDILRRTFFSSGKFTHAEKKWAKYVNQTHTRVCNYRLELVKGVYSRSPVWKALSLKTHSVVGQCGWPNVRTFSERSRLKDETVQTTWNVCHKVGSIQHIHNLTQWASVSETPDWFKKLRYQIRFNINVAFWGTEPAIKHRRQFLEGVYLPKLVGHCESETNLRPCRKLLAFPDACCQVGEQQVRVSMTIIVTFHPPGVPIISIRNRCNR